jgi:putative ABC transport system permease protein
MIRTWQLGLKSLAVHPLRSLLTVLGIFIGVASVIWLLAIGEGISRKAQQQIEDLGATNVLIRTVKPTTFDEQGIPRYGLTRDDYDALVATIPTIRTTLQIREIYPHRFSYGPRALDGRLVGCEPEYATAMRLAIDRGRFLSDTDLAAKENVCVLAAEVAQTLFPLEDPLGKVVNLDDDKTCVVVGVLKPRIATAAIGGSIAAQQFNADIYIPITALWARITGDQGQTMVRRAGSFSGEEVQLSQITLQIASVSDVPHTADAIRRLLAMRHDRGDYAVVVPQELLEQARTTRLMFMVLMGLIAAISLVVGGIGIMNIMLATVTERTREIGIRRALGAKRGDITRQFLVETIALSVVGGATGILAGFVCPWVVGQVRHTLESTFPEAMQNVPEMVRSAVPVIVPWSIPLAFGISVAVGVLFGLYPAIRAAEMDPIEALRHE